MKKFLFEHFSTVKVWEISSKSREFVDFLKMNNVDFKHVQIFV